MGKLELEGVWWLPEKANNKIAGKLNFDNETGGELLLVGTLLGMNNFTSITWANSETPIILGMATNGERITLHRCYQTRQGSLSSESHDSPSTSTFKVMQILVGQHFNVPEEIAFDRIAISYDRLNDWIKISGFEYLYPKGTKTKRVVTVKYSRPNTPKVTVNGFTIRIQPALSWTQGTVQCNLEQRIFVEVQSPRPLSLEAFKTGHFSHLQNFISLGLGHPIYPIEIVGYLLTDREESKKRSTPLESVKIYEIAGRVITQGKTSFLKGQLFDFSSIRDHYQQCLTHWFDRAETLKTASDLYFLTVYGSDAYSEGRFLNLAQAVETYHRHVRGGSHLDGIQFEDVHKALLETLKKLGLSSEVCRSYTDKMKYLNELSLRRRLKEVLKSCGKSIKIAIPNSQEFIDRVVNTRNYLTHYDPERLCCMKI